MAVEDADDRATYLADFGVAAIHNGSTVVDAAITVLFENSYTEVELGRVGVESRRPVATCPEADAENVAQDDTLEIDDVLYDVKEVQPDGQGWVEIFLHKRQEL